MKISPMGQGKRDINERIIEPELCCTSENARSALKVPVLDKSVEYGEGSFATSALPWPEQYEHRTSRRGTAQRDRSTNEIKNK